ncbi:hypothetical protein BsWGS_06919 [Bradybaena similaris]
MHMDRVCEARRRLAQAAALASQRDPGCSHLLTDDAARADLGLSHHNQRDTDQSYIIEEKTVPEKPRRQIHETRPQPDQSQSCPPSLEGIKRDHIYKILHPHTTF